MRLVGSCNRSFGSCGDLQSRRFSPTSYGGRSKIPDSQSAHGWFIGVSARSFACGAVPRKLGARPSSRVRFTPSPHFAGSMAEREGFEPSVLYKSTTVFESAAFNPSATSPRIPQSRKRVPYENAIDNQLAHQDCCQLLAALLYWLFT